MELVKSKVIGKIVERGRGFSSWIKFGERCLVALLEGVEDCYKRKCRESFRRVCNESGKGYKLELRNNKPGRFLLCTTLCVEENVLLGFPRGKRFPRGLEDPCHQTKEHWGCSRA